MRKRPFPATLYNEFRQLELVVQSGAKVPGTLGGGSVEPGATLERQRRRHDRLILITGRRLHIATVIGARTKGENYGN